MFEHVEKLLLLNALVNIGIISSQNGLQTIQSILFSTVNRQRSKLQYRTGDFIVKAGYPFENHYIRTEDGFVLNVHRIPYSNRTLDDCSISYSSIENDVNYFPATNSKYTRCKRKIRRGNPYGPDRPAVFIQHGILLSSESWVLQGPNKDLAFLLSDAGYDVWLGNYRGNFYSRRHERLSPNTEQFWDSSFHEMGYYDLPAVIDYIEARTGNEKIFYVGHSMGSTMFLVMSATRPEYNRKIRMAALLSPVTYLEHSVMSETKKAVFVALEAFLTTLTRNKIYELFPRTGLGIFAAGSLCRMGSPLQNLCNEMIFSWAGNQSRFTGKRVMPLVLSHVPAGMPVKALSHFSQLTQLEKFQQFQYDFEENERRYNQSYPPSYDLSQITVPLSLHYSAGDSVSVESDVMRLAKLLPNVVNIHKVVNPKFNHVDFIWAQNADELLYRYILEQFDKY